MPRISVNDVELYYEDTGSPHGNDSETPIVFLHGLLWDHRTWAEQIDAFRHRRRCITFDHRGHGQSEVPHTDFIDLETFYLDAAAVIDALQARPCHLVGMSMGGAIAMRVAARRPELVQSLTIAGATDRAQDEESTMRFKLLNLVARVLGVGPISGQVMPLMFSDAFLDDEHRDDERQRWEQVLSENDSTIHKAVTGFLNRPPITTELPLIDRPTQVIHGTEDAAIDFGEGESLADRLPRAQFHSVPDCGHMVPLERPEDFNTMLERFIDEHEQPAEAGVGPGEFRTRRTGKRPRA